MNFDKPSEAPHCSLALSNSEPDRDESNDERNSHKVHPTSIGKISINPSDVLCGRGKSVFDGLRS